MLCFTIALRSQASTDQWNKVLTDFEATLNSVFNQTCSEFQVYVGCNEIPQLAKQYDGRLHFVCVDTPKPQDWLDGCRDRAWKQLACCYAIRKDFSAEADEGSIFVFPVDADDFVSNRIAEYVRRHPEAYGFKSPKSYRWHKDEKRMEISPYFGGTMNIIRLLPDEMPEVMPDIALCFDKENCGKLNEKYPVRWDDIAVEKKMAQLGRPMSHLPFRSTIYVLGTGSNISSHDPRQKKKTPKKLHLGVILRRMNIFRWKKLSYAVRQEFGML